MNSGEKQSIVLHYDVPKEGKYWLLIGMCDPDTAECDAQWNCNCNESLWSHSCSYVWCSSLH